jgi:hypothetical protein
MNSPRSTYKNSISQSDGMRADRRCFCDKASVTPFSQRNHLTLILEGHAYNDQHDTTAPQQTRRAQMAATPSAKISSQAPCQMQLSP